MHTFIGGRRDGNLAADASSRDFSYAGASTHYLSENRRDAVKRFWEEPLNHRILYRAVQQLPAEQRASLAVFDVGAGTGDGLALLRAALGHSTPISYLGFDLDTEMIDTARRIHQGQGDVEFCQGDIRNGLPEQKFDIYLSSGVPYSHLTLIEFNQAIADILGRIRRNGTISSVVIDVLGRYSIEWPTRWQSDRWQYNMSFFPGEPQISSTMTFHTQATVQDAFLRAADLTGVSLKGIDYYDRSVIVGRHTGTGCFNASLPPYRTLINHLFNGDTEAPLASLRITAPSEPAPPQIIEFFHNLAINWNTQVDEAIENEAKLGPSEQRRRALAQHLCGIEHRLQRGLGAAHSLIAVATVNGIH